MTVKQTIKMMVWAALVLAKAICGQAQPGAVQEHFHQGAEIGDIEFFTISCN